MHMQELGKPSLFKNWRKKPVSVKSIHDLEDSFADKTRPCLHPEMYVFTLVRKRGVIRAVTPM